MTFHNVEYNVVSREVVVCRGCTSQGFALQTTLCSIVGCLQDEALSRTCPQTRKSHS